MDPLSAVGLAAAIVSFIDFGTKLVFGAKEIYNSAEGTPQDNVELEIVTKNVVNWKSSLNFTQYVPEPGSAEATRNKQRFANRQNKNDDAALKILAEQCEALAQEILRILEVLKLKGGHRRRWRSFRQAIRSLMKKEDLLRLEKRMSRLQKQIDTRMIARLSNSQVEILDQLGQGFRDQDSNLQNLKSALDSSMKDYAHRDATLHKLSNTLTTFVEANERIGKQHRILESLHFEMMKSRYQNIPEAHQTTFEWIFEDAMTEKKTRFINWLSSGRGIYWVCGKPGSGKSTLMKFLVGDERTKKYLQTWAGTDTLVQASFYFWNSTDSRYATANSLKGLLQSLLLQVLEQCLTWLPDICKSRWDKPIYNAQEPWSVKEILAVFETLKAQRGLKAKFCFFVEGLDEYEIAENDIPDNTCYLSYLINILNGLAKSPIIKICVSSRPWDLFKKAFADSPNKLFVQHWTTGDMEKIIHDSFRDKKSEVISLENLSSIKQTIVKKAQGVFLWVVLVVRSLLRGLENNDKPHELEKRLHDFPEDLEKFFQHMLNSIEPTYQESSARIFQVITRAVQPLPLVAFEWLDEEPENPDYVYDRNIETLPEDEVLRIEKLWEVRMSARCKDLIEVSKSGSGFLASRVDVMHRTVRDFLKDKKLGIMSRFRSKTPGFDPSSSLCKLFLAIIKATPASEIWNEQSPQRETIFQLVDEFMIYANQVEIDSNHCEVDLLAHLDEIMSTIFTAKDTRLRGVHWTNLQSKFEEYGQKTFLALAIESNLRLYTAQSLVDGPRGLWRTPQICQKRGRPLLDYALRRRADLEALYNSNELCNGIDVDMIRLLIARGADPNQRLPIFDDLSIWEKFIEYLMDYHLIREGVSMRERLGEGPENNIFEAMKELLTNSANPIVRIRSNVVAKSTVRSERMVQQVAYVNGSVDEILDTVFSKVRANKLTALVVSSQKSTFSIWGFLGLKDNDGG